MFDVVDFSTWKEYDGFAEGSGRSEKIWLISETGQIGLLNTPRLILKMVKKLQNIFQNILLIN